MRTLISILCLLPALCFSQGFGNFRTDQPFLAKNVSTLPDYTTLRTNLVDYWTFDDTVHWTNDWAGTNPLYQANGTTARGAGILSNSIWTINSRLRVYNAPNYLNFQSNSWTLTCWANMTNKNTYQQTIVGFWHSTDANLRWWALRYYSDDLHFSAWDSTHTLFDIALDSVFPTVSNQWIFYTIGFDSSRTQAFAQVQSQPRAYSSVMPNGIQYSGTPDMFSSGFYDTYYNEATWLGGIDEIGLWLRTLTTNEVSLLFNDTNGLPLSTFYP